MAAHTDAPLSSSGDFLCTQVMEHLFERTILLCPLLQPHAPQPDNSTFSKYAKSFRSRTIHDEQCEERHRRFQVR